MTHAKEDLVLQAVASGLAFTCSTCTKFHRAAERGLTTCLAVDGCGSPIVGDTFHEYEGPITDFLKYCFVCGEPSQKAVAVKGHARRLGICLKHLDYVVAMAPKDPSKRSLPMAPRTFGSEGVERPVELLLPKKDQPKTLGGILAEMEKGTFEPDK